MVHNRLATAGHVLGGVANQEGIFGPLEALWSVLQHGRDSAMARQSHWKRKFGKNLKEIAKDYGVSLSYIWTWLHRYPNWKPGDPKPTGSPGRPLRSAPSRCPRCGSPNDLPHQCHDDVVR